MNNGVVILAAIDDRRVTIQVGYGIEPYVTDGRAKRIIENDVLPAFRNNDYYGGLDAASTRVMGMLLERSFRKMKHLKDSASCRC